MQHSSQDYQNNAPFRGFLCFKRRETSWKAMPQRTIYPNLPDTTLPGNQVITSKYTWLSFLPKNLLEQFSHMANIYFLVLSGLEMINEISTTGGTPVLLFPLTFIVILTAAKDFFEDYKRHKSDNEENGRQVQIYSINAKEFEQKPCKNLRVGHITKVLRNEPVPADMVVVHTSEKKDICYIETKNLDGETALKVKYGLKETATYSDEMMLSSASDLQFDYDRPTPAIYHFQGVLKKGETSYPIDYQNFVPRGSTIRNTEHIYGLVVYTGHETKIMLNSVAARSKDSSVDRMLSRQVVTVFAIQIILCSFAAYWYNTWAGANLHNHFYIHTGVVNDSGLGPFLIRAGNWILIFTNLVPISLQVVIEIVRFIQANAMMSDYNLRTQEISCVVQSSNLNEDLGKVHHVFSDKTGTLTRNQMVFKKFFIHDQIFGERYQYVLSREQLNLTENVDFRDEDFFDLLRKKNTLIYHKAHELLLAQAICHEAIVEEHHKRRSYDAASPDELALVNFARLCRFEFRGIDEDNNVVVKFEGQEHKFLQLAVLKFTSSRKRSSILVQNPVTGTKELYVKGADSVMLSLATKEDSKTIADMAHAAEKFANEGLRTLVFGKKIIEEITYSKWLTKYKEAAVVLENREEKIEEVFAELEQGLQLIGVTAIEDKLQDQVDETIEFMKRVNIDFWMLTGDQIGTAKSVAVSCKLMDHTMTEILIDGKEGSEVQEALDQGLKIAQTQLSQNAPVYTVVTGDAVHAINKKPNFEAKFMRIADVSETVIAARISPLQKQLLVQIVRRYNPEKITLAIGDGANDVNMIIAAHIGVGIKGREGKQAARASDYSFGEFKHLKKLMFYYGRECYRRNTICVLYNFFKNVILVLPQFWYGFLNNFCGQNLYEPFVTQLYNLFYCSIPIIVFAVFDQQYQITDYLTKPHLYELGQKSIWSPVKGNFFGWVLSAALQSIPLGILTYYTQENIALDGGTGLLASFWYSGNVAQMIAVILSNFKVLLFTNRHYLLSVSIVFGSIVFYYANLGIVNQIVVDQLYYTLTLQSTSAYFYLTIFVILCLTVMSDYACTVSTTLNENSKSSQKSAKEKLDQHKEEDIPLMYIL